MRVILRHLGFLSLGILSGARTDVRAQSPTGQSLGQRELRLERNEYRLHAGERILVEAPQEELTFIRNAKQRTLTLDGIPAKGFVLGANLNGEVVLGVSLTTKADEYSLVMSASSESGERRTTPVHVRVDALAPVPSNAAGPPVVLLDGFQASLDNSCPMSMDSSGNFGNLQLYLQQSNLPVYFFENCTQCPNCTIEELGVDLALFLSSLQYDSGNSVPQVDLIAHSMGGLIVRCYLAGKLADESFKPPATTGVRKAVFIATPHFGAFVADDPFVSLLFSQGNQLNELKPGSQFLWDLSIWNQDSDDLRGVDTIAIIGNGGSYGNMSNASDGVVSLTSASLLFAATDVRTRILKYCHIPGDFSNPASSSFATVTGCAAPGIAYIDSPTHPSYLIINSFLANTTFWQTIGNSPSEDQYLSQNGGILMAAKDAQDIYFNDLLSVSMNSIPLSPGPSNSLTGTYFDNWLTAGSYNLSVLSESTGTITGSWSEQAGGYVSVFFKEGPVVQSVISQLSTGQPGLTVASGSGVAINGIGFDSTSVVTAAGVQISTSSISPHLIMAYLPASIQGLVPIRVITSAGQSSINILVAPASQPPAIALSASSLQFQ